VDQNQLVARVLAGDGAAEREFYDAHVDRVYGLAYRMAGDENLAEEFTQQTFVRAFDKLETFRGESKLSTWLHRIATSVVLNGLRGVRRFRSRETDLEAGNRVAHRAEEVEPDLKRRLYEAIDALPDNHRAVFVMHEIEGYKHQEIAEIMEIRVGTSKSHLHRARATLRDKLSDFAAEWAS
jgi:RNA polymerase sigma-70 factor (ECF subfamily)